MKKSSDLRDALASIDMREAPGADNLAIALCTYFEKHPERPEDDPEADSGWGEWVEMMTNKALDRLEQAALRGRP